MFYSQTFLARKGPLGTVWCAAHLQHLLKKSHYTSTNVPTTVDLIMFPEVPLALRMSGHLLLGVVRIYSKKVDYLFHDCNVVLTWLAKAFVSSKVDLPEETRQAPVESVTLPETLNLDDFNIDDDALERDTDSHLRSQEEITLTDQIPTDTDPYVAITFDEDIFEDLRPMDVDHSTVPVTGDPDNVVGETDAAMSTKEAESNNPPGTSDVAMDPKISGPDNETEEIAVNIELQESRPSNLAEVLDPGSSNANSPQSAPEIEKMRDAVHDTSPGIQPPFPPNQMNDTVELTECLDETLNEKEYPTPVIEEETLRSGGHSPFQPRSESPAFAVHEEEPLNLGHSSPQLALRSTPPPAQQQPQPRPRKRKQLFDRVTVLPNRILKQRLDDPSDTLRTKRDVPSNRLKIWRHNNWARKEQLFSEPLLTGLSGDLRDVFQKDYIASKPHLVADTEAMAAVSPTQEAEIETEDNPEFTTVQSPTVVLSYTQETETAAVPEFTVPQSPCSATEANLDERGPQSPTQNTEVIPEFAVPQSPHPWSEATIAQSSQSFRDNEMEIERLRDSGVPEFMQSPSGFSPVRTDEYTPQFGTSGTATTTPAFTAETASYGTEPETPRTIPEDLPGPGTSGLSDIPEIDEELSFLETGGDTPAGSPAIQRSDALSVRSRALARYLKDQSSSSPSSKGPSGDLSLSKILEGKTRKLSARMFFETLVLKTNKLIDVQQEQPYGDITLKLLPALFSKAQL